MAFLDYDGLEYFKGKIVGEIPTVDDTLSVAGAAAGAAAVGAALAGKAANAAVYSVYPTDTASGAVASFPDGADDIPVKDLTIGINAVQSGSGDPSPSNVRPITGWTGANIVVSPTEDAQDGTTYSVDWTDEAGTVYGGTLDVTTGVLTVTRYDLDVGSWGAAYWTEVDASNGIFRINISQSNTDGKPRKIYTTAAVDDQGLSNQYKFAFCNNESYTKNNLQNGQYSYGVSGTITYFRNTSCSTIAQMVSAMNGVHLVYPLATPITYQLTPQEVKTLLGVNNIWAETGDVTVDYRADTALYIDKKITEAIE